MKRYNRLFSNGSGLLFATLAVLVASPQAARADTKTLVCNYDSGLQVTLELNEGDGKATINFPPEIFGNTASPGVTETYAATFDSKQITFGGKVPARANEAWRKITIDRMTGSLIEFFSEKAPYDEAAPEDKAIKKATCQAGQAKF